MPKIKMLFLTLTLIFNLAFAQSIKFAPLPQKSREELIGEYIPLINYLRENTGLNIEIVYIESYEKLIEEFKSGNIHIATFGPLSYFKLKQEYKDAQPIVYVREKDGSISYRCVMVSPPDGPKSIGEIKGPVALPQKLSTCGEFAAKVILSNYSKDLGKLGYKVFNDHNQAVEAMLRGECETAVIRENIYQDYKGFGIKALAYSPPWPSMTVVVNAKSLSKDKIDSIKTALISASWKDLREFGFGKFGFLEVKKEDYEYIFKYKRFIPQ